MKQTLKNILGVGVIALFFYLLFSILNFAQSATPEEQKPELKTNPQYNMDLLTLRQVPMYCGHTGFVFQTAFEVFGEYPAAAAEVRSKGNLENPVVALLTFTYNKNWKKGTLLMTIPSTGETCILGYGVNWEFYGELSPDGKKILDEGNESK